MTHLTTSATIIADSFYNSRLTTFLLTYPRVVLCEFNTHKMLSKNAASSRAIPISTRVHQVATQPYEPIFLGANQKGMQAHNTLPYADEQAARILWYNAALSAANTAQALDKLNVHKTMANRVMEPFVWVSQIVTGTEWGNFFNLRVHEDADDPIHELAGHMLRAYYHGKPKILQPGEWHIPYGDRIPPEYSTEDRLKVSAARLARLSYDRHDGTFSPEQDIALATSLQNAGHMSPTEHAGQAQYETHFTSSQDLRDFLQKENAHWDGEWLWWGPFRGWKQYRKQIPDENRIHFDAVKLLNNWRELRKARGYVEASNTCTMCGAEVSPSSVEEGVKFTFGMCGCCEHLHC